MKGKKLKIGQHVLILKAPGKKGVSVTVLTVVAIQLPFVVFEYDCDHPAMVGIGPNGPVAHGSERRKEVFTMDVRGCRFKEVDDAFATAAAGRTEPSWLHDED